MRPLTAAMFRELVEAAAADDCEQLDKCHLAQRSTKAPCRGAPPNNAELAATLDAIGVPRPPPTPGAAPLHHEPGVPVAQQV